MSAGHVAEFIHAMHPAGSIHISGHVLWAVDDCQQFESENDQAPVNLLTQAGFREFDSFWNLPHEFVDDINHRRGGWSATSRLSIAGGEGRRIFYLKRQENQLRYSLSMPLGELTYHYELAAISRNNRLRLPGAEVACSGFRKVGKKKQGYIVTSAIHSPSLAELISEALDPGRLTQLFAQLGNALYDMHCHRISHGSLYPNHIFIDQGTGKVGLIDFERSRTCLTVRSAIKRDLYQLVKRLAGLPADAMDALLQPYRNNHSRLLNSILSRAARK